VPLTEQRLGALMERRGQRLVPVVICRLILFAVVGTIIKLVLDEIGAGINSPSILARGIGHPPACFPVGRWTCPQQLAGREVGAGRGGGSLMGLSGRNVPAVVTVLSNTPRSRIPPFRLCLHVGRTRDTSIRTIDAEANDFFMVYSQFLTDHPWLGSDDAHTRGRYRRLQASGLSWGLA
jgi:hypothetical protein